MLILYSVLTTQSVQLSTARIFFYCQDFERQNLIAYNFRIPVPTDLVEMIAVYATATFCATAVLK